MFFYGSISKTWHPPVAIHPNAYLTALQCMYTYIRSHAYRQCERRANGGNPTAQGSQHSLDHSQAQAAQLALSPPPAVAPAYRPRLAPAYRPRSAPAYRPRLAPAYRPRLTPGVQPIGLGPGSSPSATVPSSLRTLYLSLSSGRLAAADLKERVRVQMDEKTPSKSDATNSVGQGRTVGAGFFFTTH